MIVEVIALNLRYSFDLVLDVVGRGGLNAAAFTYEVGIRRLRIVSQNEDFF